MTERIMTEILKDDIAFSIAHVMTVANKRARELGINILESLITITQHFLNGNALWLINYGPKNYIGRRGGDLIIEIDATDTSIKQVIWGQ